MPVFTYTAIDASGRTVKASIEAESESLVLAKLRDQALHCTEIKRSSGGMKLSIGRSKVPLKSLVVFSRQFATMINAGIPILRCLDIAAGQMKDVNLKKALGQITTDVKSGLTLNEAMSKHPRVFNKLFVNMIKAAEVGGILDQILERLAGFLEYEAEVKGKIKGAMMYPVMVMCASAGVLFAMFSFVLPHFKAIFDGMKVDLPPTTKMLFSMGDFMNQYWYVILAAMAGAFFGLKFYTKTPRGRWQKDWVMMRAPIFGPLGSKMSIARFCRTFGTLINSGVPMMRSLEIVGETLGNVLLVDAVDQTRLSIREGNRLSTPLAKSGLFPDMVICMIDIGEESGKLSEMLVKIGDFYDREVETTVKGLTSLIEPLLIVFMGGIVGFIVMSIMTPIFKLVSSIH